MKKEFTEKLKEKRNAYGISQNKLAIAVSVSKPFISQIENGKKKVSEEMQNLILATLEKMSPNAPMNMIFDYVRIRFPTTDVKEVIRKILKLRVEFMLHEPYAFYGYSEHFAMGDIVVMSSPKKDKGVLLELKGRGCRQFESFLLAQERSWYDFFVDTFDAKGVMKRIDLAINDKVGILNIPKLVKKCEAEECVSVCRSFDFYRSGELKQKEEKIGMGNTLYIGSKKSEVYFCLYEKDYEQYQKLGTPIEESEIKNRFEIRLKNERAYHAVKELLKTNDAERITFDIINRYMRFVDAEEGKRRSKWKMNEEWKVFIGEGREKIKLTTAPEPYTFDKTLRWITKQVAPTLKTAILLDKINGTEVINMIIENAELSERHEKILKQQAVPIEKVVLN